jgi:hypothetical protein
MEPSVKSEQVEQLIKDNLGVDRRDVIRNNHCVPPPIGCGAEVTDNFRDELSRKEYTISGLCQSCQDSIFGEQG